MHYKLQQHIIVPIRDALFCIVELLCLALQQANETLSLLPNSCYLLLTAYNNILQNSFQTLYFYLSDGEAGRRELVDHGLQTVKVLGTGRFVQDAVHLLWLNHTLNYGLDCLTNILSQLQWRGERADSSREHLHYIVYKGPQNFSESFCSTKSSISTCPFVFLATLFPLL